VIGVSVSVYSNSDLTTLGAKNGQSSKSIVGGEEEEAYSNRGVDFKVDESNLSSQFFFVNIEEGKTRRKNSLDVHFRRFRLLVY